jgi:hypothetical protein
VVKTKITGDDVNRYKNILELTIAHLEGFEPGGSIQISRGTKYREVISKLFPQSKRRGIERALRQQWMAY